MSFRKDYLVHSAETLAQHFKAAATAHICVDLQKGYCHPPLPIRDVVSFSRPFYKEAQQAIRHIADFSRSFAASGGQNIWVRHDVDFGISWYKNQVHDFKSQRTRQKLKSFVRACKELCLPCPEEDVINKKGYSSFLLTPLADRLREQKITTVLLTGGYRNHCVESTALSAQRRGLNTFIVDDLVIPYQSENSVRALEGFCKAQALEGIFVVTSDQVKKILSQPAL